MKMQHSSPYTLTIELFDDILGKIKEDSLKKTKLNSSVIVLSENKQSPPNKIWWL